MNPKLEISSDAVLQKFKSKISSMQLAEEEKVAAAAAEAAGLPHVDLRAFPVSQDALSLIPRAVAEEGQVVCFLYNQEQFRVASPVADKNKDRLEEIVHQIAERTHADGGLYFISKESFAHVIKMYDRLPVVKPVTKGVNLTAEDLDKFAVHQGEIVKFQEMIKNISITDLIAAVISAALAFNASDVHIEAEKEDVMVRFRLDGVLTDIARLQKQDWGKIVSRIKLASSLKINITDVPQDGRFTIQKPEGEIDVRVSTLPTVFGESVVMRVLKPLAEINLGELGVDGRSLKILEEQIRRPNGMIITTGPTGSGKTTTLYAALRELNKPDIKIITLEDPVEYRMPGISQSQIDSSKEYTFATGLRAMMRQDPDVAMVGEIRDLETAEVAIQAALTGHLIISTIHANSAAAAIPRFLSMGVKPFLLAPALRTIMSQRLVRRLCDSCKVKVALTPELKERLAKTFEQKAADLQVPDFEKIVFYGSGASSRKNCEKCAGLGYKGRIGIYEIFAVSPEIEALILKGTAPEAEVKDAAIRSGMVTLAQDGVLKAAKGITSLDEVFRVSE